jgi:hypothetical protein
MNDGVEIENRTVALLHTQVLYNSYLNAIAKWCGTG